MAFSLGWKDILRPIRDGYRHLFPSPDTGPTPEERNRHRKIDKLKGFTYFDTIEQLETWTEAESDPLQRANILLLPRSTLSPEENRKQADVLLCHDFSGNYRDYEAVQANGVDEESYSCEYLQFVDSFIYFSHKLVCIPPPSWTNLLHRNGVRVLGTLLVEPQTQGAERLLQHHTNGTDGSPCYPVAETLAKMACHYGFDGWLVNIEKPFPKDQWDCGVVEAFLRQLRDALGPDRKSIWYDAITTDNRVSYQNTLNSKNMVFAKACGSILINYCWKEDDARNSYQLASQTGLPPEQVYFGVDVWAQNKSSFTRPRVTYPEFGGGGTHTGIAVNKLADVGLSAGIFAPAWSFEHFPANGRAVERAMWEGASLPDNLTCSCGDTKSYHPADRSSPCIKSSARQHCAGSESFFYTDFSRAFGLHDEKATKDVYGGKAMHAQLSSQSILPYPARTNIPDSDIDDGVNKLSQHITDTVETSHLCIEARSVLPPENRQAELCESWLPLFKLGMPADGSLQLTIAYQCLVQPTLATASFYLKFANGTHRLLAADKSSNETTSSISLFHDAKAGDLTQLSELGVHLLAPNLGSQTTRILEVHSIGIIPRIADTQPHHVSIDNIRVERRGEGETEHWRLCWTYQDHKQGAARVLGMPYSDITGPFSHFIVEISGVCMGRVYARECIVPEALAKSLEDDGEELCIKGYGFDGKELAREFVRLQVD